MCFYTTTEGPRLTRILEHEICVSGTVVGRSPTNAKIPHLRIHKPKIAVVGSAVVKTE